MRVPRKRLKKLKRHPDSVLFHQLLQDIGELHDRKQLDYGKDDDPFSNVRGSAHWGVEPWIGAMIRINDKIRRLQSLVRNGRLVNESAEDSLLDIGVYSLIALVLFRKRGKR